MCLAVSFVSAACGSHTWCYLWRMTCSVAALTLVDVVLLRSQAKYVDPEKALEAKERGNEQFRAGQWALAISEYEEVS